MKEQSPELFKRAEEGFFLCGHCDHVIALPPEAEVNQTYKCVRCHKWTVRWKFPSKARPPKPAPAPVPAYSQQAQVLFSQLRGAIA